MTAARTPGVADRRARSWPAHGRLRLSLCAVLVAAAALVASGAGSEARAAKSGGGQLAAIKQLNDGRFAAIERYYLAALPFDAFNAIETLPAQAEIDAASQGLVRSCGAMNKRDPLLGPIRRSCSANASSLNASLAMAACASRTACTNALKRLRAAVKRVVVTGRVADRTVRLTRLRSACKRALVTPQAGYVLYRELDAALGAMLRALQSGSDDELAAAVFALSSIDESAVPSGAAMLDRLRSGCR